MSILRNGCVTLSNLRVNGHLIRVHAMNLYDVGIRRKKKNEEKVIVVT